MKEVARNAFYLFYRLVPKWNHVVIWAWPDAEDNSRELIAGLERAPVSRVVLLATDPEQTRACLGDAGDKCRVVPKSSIRGLCWFLTAKYVFFTHRCFMWRFPPDVVSVNVWHGMPIKRIGWMLEGNRGIDSTYTLATSEFWAGIMSRSMRPREDVLVTGLPRNDRLFRAGDAARSALGVEDDGRRVFAWLPTYRKSVRGELRNDGSESGNVFGLGDVDTDRLNQFLRERDAVVWVKPHPMAPCDGVVEKSHLKIVDDEWMNRNGLSLYGCLAASDGLISDISSVVVDYLVLDRPIIHCFPDEATYGRSRGFSVEPLEDFYAGPVVTGFDELLDCLDSMLAGRDPETQRRRAMRELFHTNPDAGSTERLLEAIGLGERR